MSRLKGLLANERCREVIAHDLARSTYRTIGLPLPDNLKVRLVFANHSRIKMKRR